MVVSVFCLLQAILNTLSDFDLFKKQEYICASMGLRMKSKTPSRTTDVRRLDNPCSRDRLV